MERIPLAAVEFKRPQFHIGAPSSVFVAGGGVTVAFLPSFQVIEVAGKGDALPPEWIPIGDVARMVPVASLEPPPAPASPPLPEVTVAAPDDVGTGDSPPARRRGRRPGA